ncbi:Basic amino-acid permease [Arthrobotrys musiformis]|uniref:Basic amino-acid permease n=1 Tax=Arthrobotrys musiformis TaxID=47236 RepID=A0AAV9VTL0_9PEZI
MYILPLASLLPLAGLFLQAAADLTVLGAGGKDKIPNSYIVVLKPSTNQAQIQEHTQKISNYHTRRSLHERGVTTGIRGQFGIQSFKGYTVECDRGTLDQILSSPEVQYVEQESKTTVKVTQKQSTWGLARLSWKTLPKQPYSYRYQNTWGGRGTTVYVVDTGVRVTHKEFEKRASWGYNAVPGSANADNHGHGTHVAGTAAGKTYGVAKYARIVAVKVIGDDGTGQDSYTLAGLDYISKVAKPGKSVVNMSIGGPKSEAVNAAVQALYKKGILVVAAAGNENENAGLSSPASAPSAITVGATDDSDTRASFSNFGSIVDIFAPGVNILSASYVSDTAVRYDNGTSMASPHVAGLAAYFISSRSTYQSPLIIHNLLISTSQRGLVKSPGPTPNRLAYNGWGEYQPYY